jgi:hypothetical protein
VLLMIGAPGLVAGLLYMFVKEPPRRSAPDASRLTAPDAPFARKFAAFMGWRALKAIWRRKAVFLPLFAALAMSAVEARASSPGACRSSPEPTAGTKRRSALCSAR